MCGGDADGRDGDRTGRPVRGDPDRGEMWVLARERVRELDRLAVERYGIPSIVLMENAALGIRDAALEMLASIRGRRAMILAGTGNNGGDGFALARHLHNAGVEPLVVLVGDPERVAGDAATNLSICRAMGVRVCVVSEASDLDRHAERGPQLLVDAMLGTGLEQAPREPIAGAIRWLCNRRGVDRPVLAVDVPSGLDCDLGRPAGASGVEEGLAVEADVTVTLAALKPGLLRLRAHRWTGEVRVAGIGAPRELVRSLGQRVTDRRPGPSQSCAPGGPPGDEGVRSGYRRDG